MLTQSDSAKHQMILFKGFILVTVLLLFFVFGASVSFAWDDLGDVVSLADAPQSIQGTCPVVPGTPDFTELYGSITPSAPAGSVITAVSPRGDVVGCFVVSTPDQYGLMRVYGEDPTAVPPIPGMKPGEDFQVYVDGILAVEAPDNPWSGDKSAHLVNLSYTLQWTITVSGTGTGNGSTVGTSPSTINCTHTEGTESGTCEEMVIEGTVVELTATAATGSVFVDWIGCDSAVANVCTQTVSGGNETVQPNFKIQRTLTVDGTGTGNGTTIGSPLNGTLSASNINPSTINCTSTAGEETGTCMVVVDENAVVELTATAAAGSVFTGWSGCDNAVSNVCTQTVSGGDEIVQPNFELERTLVVDGTGTGTGTTVGTSPSTINCTSTAGAETGTCSETVDDGTVVVLTATAPAGSVFTSWSGCDNAVGNVCTQTVSGANETVQPNFELGRSLTVDGTGTGNGTTVGTSPSTVNCTSVAGADSGTCTEAMPDGTVVELTATAAAGSVFTGWSGCDSAVDNVCTQTVSGENKTVQPNFELQWTLLVDGTGTGNGSTGGASPSTIKCATAAGADTGTCSEMVYENTVVELTAAAAADSDFTGWSGCDNAVDDVCTQTVSGADETVQPNFDLKQYTLTVDKDGDGTGTVTSNPAGIDCGATCSEDYSHGTAITLTPTADAGSVFTGWSGDCSAAGQVTMDDAKSCTATFIIQEFEIMRFRGFVYNGPRGDMSEPLIDVNLDLYGRDDGEPEPGGFYETQPTALDGFFNFHILEPWFFDNFTLMAQAPAGMVPIEAWSKDGDVVDAQTVQWQMPTPDVHENSFHFEMPTLPPTEPVTATIDLPLLTDTWVTWGDQNGNYDDYAALVARTTGLDNILFKFDRTELPQNATILNAELTVNVSGQTGSLGKSLAVLNTGVFTPKLVTYANAPIVYNPSPTVAVPRVLGPTVDVPLAPGPLTFDVASQVSAWDAPNFTSYHWGYLALSADGPFGRIIIDSLETFESTPAKLTVTYTATP